MLRRYLFLILIVNCITSSCLAIPASPTTLKIAIAGPFTGVYSAYGIQALSGATQAIADINNNGGIKGIHLELEPINDQCDPEIAKGLAQKIVDERQHHAVIGHMCSAASLATLDQYAAAKMLVISPSASYVELTHHGVNTFFRMLGNDEQQTNIAVNFLIKNLHATRIAILYSDDFYGKHLAENINLQLVKQHKTAVMLQSINIGEVKFQNVIKKFKDLQVDAIYFAAMYPEVAALAKALSVNQIQIPILTSDGSVVSNFIKLAGGNKVTNSVLMTFGPDPKTFKINQEIVRDMRAKNLEVDGYALYAYAAIQAVAAAIEHTDTTDGEKLAHYLHHHQVNTVLGTKSWDTNGDLFDTNFYIYLWDEKGNYVQLK
jgi:branched-chain amino acid transport system substrate-binding protein